MSASSPPRSGLRQLVLYYVAYSGTRPRGLYPFRALLRARVYLANTLRGNVSGNRDGALGVVGDPVEQPEVGGGQSTANRQRCH